MHIFAFGHIFVFGAVYLSVKKVYFGGLVMESSREKINFDSIERYHFAQSVSTKEFISDGAKLLSVSASACAGRCEMLNGEVVIEGNVHFVAVFRDGEGKIERVERAERFTLNENIPGADARATAFAKCRAEKVRGYTEAGSLMLSAVADICLTVIMPGEKEILVLGEDEDLRKKENTVTLSRITFAQNLRFTVSDTGELSLRLPEAKDILFVSVLPKVNETHVSGGQLIIGGEMQVQTVYSSLDEYEPIVEITDKFDFSRIVDVPDAAGQAEVFLAPENVAAQIKTNADNEARIIEYTVDLCGYAYALEEKEYSCISDVYSVKNNLDVKREKFTVKNSVSGTKTQINRNFSVTLPENKPTVSRIGSVVFSPNIKECKMYDNRAVLSGTGEVSVIYQSAGSGEPEGFFATVPIEFTADNVECRGEVSAEAELFDMQAVLISGNEIEIRCGMTVNIFGLCGQESETVTEINDNGENDMPEFGIIIYTVQKSDRIWDICKRFCVDENEVRSLNPELKQEPTEGEKIYIFIPLKP